MIYRLPPTHVSLLDRNPKDITISALISNEYLVVLRSNFMPKANMTYEIRCFDTAYASVHLSQVSSRADPVESRPTTTSYMASLFKNVLVAPCQVLKAWLLSFFLVESRSCVFALQRAAAA